MRKVSELIIHTDGGARGNPGPAAIGIVISKPDGEVLLEYKEVIGQATNNMAEYMAVVKALELVERFEPEAIDFYLDSELVVKQLNQEYKVKNEELGKLFMQIWNKLKGFKHVTFTHIPRAQNKRADALVNKALDA